jgi:Ca-activated chloride channel family protein
MKKTVFAFLATAALLLSACDGYRGEAGDYYNHEDGYHEDGYDYYYGYSYEGESYLDIVEGGVRYAAEYPETTFSLKVDTAAYNNVKRYIEDGGTPPANAVRTEELINYFSYDSGVSFNRDDPFGVYAEIGPSPFDGEKLMAFIRVKTRDIATDELPDSNLVFLVDSSGSMSSHDKLPLLKEAFGMLAETLGPRDRVSVVTYAGSSEIVLAGARGDDTAGIMRAVNRLSAGGSTAGADGIETAYKLAGEFYIEGGNNRVILATDGDFNVGISDTDELAGFISGRRDTGIYLSVLGLGTGNIRDDIMETLAKHGNGNYSYIDSLSAAKKVLVEERGAMFTVADDVKAQIAFNPDSVVSYRLIGYENRMMDDDDFEDDRADAGEIGAGSDVVVMVEMEARGEAGELFEVRLRYKTPGEGESRLLAVKVGAGDIAERNSSDFGFACSVAVFGHLLRGSEYAGGISAEDALNMAEENIGQDRDGYRREFIMLLEQYGRLIGR